MNDYNKRKPGPFEGVTVNAEGKRLMKMIDREYRELWNKLKKTCDKCPESYNALNSLQASHFYIKRACALSHIDEPHEHANDNVSRETVKFDSKNPRVMYKKSKI